MMTRNNLKQTYFYWMCGIICENPNFERDSYYTLLDYLYNKTFYYIIDMDDNREADGIDLRYRFACEKGYNTAMVASYLDDKPCSILEMITSLIIRCQDMIGYRDDRWFWDMLISLGLEEMSDEKFDEDYVNRVIDRFLNRRYERNGKGGLFTVTTRSQDLRNVEIWYQMCWYLKENC